MTTVTGSTQSRRRSGEETREAILAVAADVFRRRGFGAATLEDIAEPLGITRAAVLHHYHSKAAVLVDVVAPLMARVDDLLDRVASGGPLQVRQQRAFLREFVDLLCDNRSAAALLIRDVTAQEHLGPDLQLSDRAARFAAIASSTSLQQAPSVRALAALGAVTRPVSAPDGLVDLSGDAERRVLVDCAVAALRAGGG